MRIVLAAFLLVVTGCVSVMGVANRRSTTAQIDASKRTEIWNKAINDLQDQGYVIETVNEAAALIKTERGNAGLVSCGFSLCQATDLVTVTISPTGLARIDLRRRVRGNNGDSFEPMAESDVDAVEREQARLLSLITGKEIKPGPRAKATSTTDAEAGNPTTTNFNTTDSQW